MSEPHNRTPQRLAIAGGGITGLTAAYYAIQQGQPGSAIDVYEGSDRLGGQIRSVWRDGKVINKGAEFIDSTHTELRAICAALNVPLLPSTDQGEQSFQRADGSIINGAEFMEAFEPVFYHIRRHREEVLKNPEGALAQKLDQMSLAEYMAHMGATIPRQNPPPFFARVKKWFGMDENRVDPEILTMAMQAYVSESGRAPEEINARQFVHEVSSTNKQILESDCAYRVEGGTEKIVDALKNYLTQHGVRFHENAALARVDKQGEKLQLNFENTATPPAATDRLLLALPTYSLAKIEGLEHLGLPQGTRAKLADMQYTNSVKFTVPLKPGVKMSDGNFFSIHGYQAWSALDGQMTFLASAKDMKSPKQLIREVLEDFARSHGQTSEKMFVLEQGSVEFSNPGKSPCYASPGKGQVNMAESFRQAFSNMAASGVTVAGSFLPLRRGNEYGIGFIEAGVVSGQQAIDQLQLVSKGRAPYLEKIIGHGSDHDRSASSARATR